MIREIVKYGDPRLHGENEEIAEFGAELAALIQDLVETCHAAPGLGLAAPQIGINRRVAIVDLSIGADPSGVVVLVNPTIVSELGDIRAEEGCLSIPGVSEPLTRPAKVVVEAADADGRRRRIDGESLFARALLHETDHLNSRLFVERIRGLKGELVRRKLERRFGSAQAVTSRSDPSAG